MINCSHFLKFWALNYDFLVLAEWCFFSVVMVQLVGDRKSELVHSSNYTLI